MTTHHIFKSQFGRNRKFTCADCNLRYDAPVHMCPNHSTWTLPCDECIAEPKPLSPLPEARIEAAPTPVKEGDVNTQLLAWAVSNCHTLARRRLKAQSIDAEWWQHVLRICEKAGATSKGVLRAAVPTELTEGSNAPVPEGVRAMSKKHEFTPKPNQPDECAICNVELCRHNYYVYATPAPSALEAPREQIVLPTTAGGNVTEVTKEGIYVSKPFSQLRDQMSPEAQARVKARTAELSAQLDAEAQREGTCTCRYERVGADGFERERDLACPKHGRLPAVATERAQGLTIYCTKHVAPFPCPTCEREREGYISPSTPEALDTTWLTKLMSDKVIEHERTIATLTTENARLKQEAEDEQRSQLMLGDLLGRTRDALKGKPPELTLYSTHDLPEVATALTAQLADLTAKVASVTELLRNVIGASASCSAEKGRRYKQCANCIALADAEAFLFPVPTPEDK